MVARRLIVLVSSGLYTGYVPFASGTVASVLAVGLYLPVAALNVASPRFFFYALLIAALTGVGIWTSGLAERIHGVKDSHKIVIDEIVGYFYAMILLPTTWKTVLAAFLLFRAFDVLKPFPIRRSQRLPGGIGVMIDDILAGIYTCVLLHILRILVH
jgi:phosphatidylglycerophosphatase A